MRAKPVIDYLFLFGTFQADLETISPHGMDLVNLQKSTSIFKKQYELKLNGVTYASIVYQPHSSILPHNSGMIKISNFLLYSSDLKATTHHIFSCLGFEFKRVSRVDIAVDLVKFDNDYSPPQLISNFLHNTIKKDGRSKFKVIGSNSGVKSYEYLKFGSGSSEISSYIYNKSLEMQQVKAKQWIFDHWRVSGWNGFSDVWRLEFSLKLQSKMILNANDAEILDFTLEDLFNPDFLPALFNSLLYSHFRFYKINLRQRGSQLVSDKEYLQLLKIRHSDNYKLITQPVVEGNRSKKLLVSRLYNLHKEMKGNATIERMFDNGLYSDLVKELGLSEWARLNDKF
jgi:hypothetical protein